MGITFQPAPPTPSSDSTVLSLNEGTFTNAGALLRESFVNRCQSFLDHNRGMVLAAATLFSLLTVSCASSRKNTSPITDLAALNLQVGAAADSLGDLDLAASNGRIVGPYQKEINRALELAGKDDVESRKSGLDLFSDIARENEKNPEFHFKRGLALKNCNFPSEAARSFYKALELAPDDLNIRVELAGLLTINTYESGGFEALQKAVELLPDPLVNAELANDPLGQLAQGCVLQRAKALYLATRYVVKDQRHILIEAALRWTGRATDLLYDDLKKNPDRSIKEDQTIARMCLLHGVLGAQVSLGAGEDPLTNLRMVDAWFRIAAAHMSSQDKTAFLTPLGLQLTGVIDPLKAIQEATRSGPRDPKTGINPKYVQFLVDRASADAVCGDGKRWGWDTPIGMALAIHGGTAERSAYASADFIGGGAENAAMGSGTNVLPFAPPTLALICADGAQLVFLKEGGGRYRPDANTQMMLNYEVTAARDGIPKYEKRVAVTVVGGPLIVESAGARQVKVAGEYNYTFALTIKPSEAELASGDLLAIIFIRNSLGGLVDRHEHLVTPMDILDGSNGRKEIHITIHEMLIAGSYDADVLLEPAVQGTFVPGAARRILRSSISH